MANTGPLASAQRVAPARLSLRRAARRKVGIRAVFPSVQCGFYRMRGIVLDF